MGGPWTGEPVGLLDIRGGGRQGRWPRMSRIWLRIIAEAHGPPQAWPGHCRRHRLSDRLRCLGRVFNIAGEVMGLTSFLLGEVGYEQTSTLPVRLSRLPRHAATILVSARELTRQELRDLDAQYQRLGRSGLYPFPGDGAAPAGQAFEELLGLSLGAATDLDASVAASVISDATLTAIAVDLARWSLQVSGDESADHMTLTVRVLERWLRSSPLGTESSRSLAARVENRMGCQGKDLVGFLLGEDGGAGG